MKLSYWRAFALLLSWVILACLLAVINHTTQHIEWYRFVALCVYCACYLIVTAVLFKPLTKNPK